MWKALTSRLGRQSRFLVVVAILIVNAAIVAIAWTPPVQKPAIDWSVGPFYGPEQVSAWLAALDTPLMFPGRVRAHRVWVMLTACAVLALLFQRAWRAADHGEPFGPRTFITPRPLFSSTLSLASLVLALLVISATTISSLCKVPDFSRHDRSTLHVALNHYELLAPADHVAAGDRLFIDVMPSYGVLWPVIVGAYQRWFGLCSLGVIIKILFTVNAVLISFFAVSMYSWSRGRLICWVLPLVLVCGYYLPVQAFLIPPNHCLVRSGALVVGPIAWSLATQFRAFMGSGILGAVSAVSLATNFEVGFSITIGSLGVAAFQWAMPVNSVPRPYAGCLAVLLGFLLGGAVAVGTIEVVATVALGQYLPLPSIILPSRYAMVSSGAYLTYPPHRWVVPLLCVMLVHAAGTLLLVSVAPVRSRRLSVRAGVCTVLLVWMAYPVNRPHTEYLYSTYFLYGFLLVDTVRALTWRIRTLLKSKLLAPRLPVPLGVSAVMVVSFAALWLLMRHDVRQRGGDRWEAGFVRHTPGERLTSGVLLSEALSEAENTRAAFIARKSRERGGRVVFISSDAFLISRIAGSIPSQPFSEPAICVNRNMYNEYLNRVEVLTQDEFFIDTRNTARATWYGFVNDIARNDFGQQFDMVGSESGWEIWRRRR